MQGAHEDHFGNEDKLEQGSCARQPHTQLLGTTDADTVCCAACARRRRRFCCEVAWTPISGWHDDGPSPCLAP